MLWEWWERYRRLLLAVGAILFLGSSIWWYLADQAAFSREQTDAAFTPAAVSPAIETKEATATDTNPENSQANVKSEKEPMPAPIYVDVKGRVKSPGVYRFETDMRVADAIEKAGGPLPDADLEQINLAQPLQDGSAIVIPGKNSSRAKQGENSAPATLQPFVPAGLPGNQANSRVNLNTATKEELMKLPGIGEAKAQAILEHRENKRPFRSPEELKQISGIGDKMYERLKDHVRVQ